MIAAWILYALLVGGLLGGGALVVETLLRAHRLPTRWVWGGAMALSFVWPLGHILLEKLPGPVGQGLPIPDPSGIVALEPLAVQVGSESFLRALDGPLLGAWVLASGILLALFALLLVRTHRLRKEWDGADAAGQPILLSQDWGPAVVGFFQPKIVLPTWCKELEEQTLQLIVDHEAEHVRAGDLRLILSTGLLPILAPWNLMLWWQFSRLRGAVEGDCDLRVLRKHPEQKRPYLELLLEVGKRNPRTRALAATLSESEETLERRIRIMTWPIPKKPWTRGVLLAGMGAFLVALACWAPGPMVEEEADAALPEVEARAPEEGAVALGDPEVIEEEGAAPGTTYTVQPQVTNPEDVVVALEEEYPPLLKDAGIEGTAVIWFYVDENGVVQRVQVNESSGHKALDDAALRVASIVEFIPALKGNERVPVWISLPIDFTLGTRVRPNIPDPDTEVPAALPENLIVDRFEEPPLEKPPGAEAEVDISRAPTFTPYTVRPDIRNRAEIARALEDEYPRDLRDEGIGGTVQIWFFIDKEGFVQRVQINQSSGHEELDDAALNVAEMIEFTPALNRDEPVPVWISLPITFTTRDGSEGQTRTNAPPEDRARTRQTEVSELPPPAETRDRDISAAPTFTPYTVRPDIRNRTEVARALEREYPPLLRDAGIGGTIHVWFFIDEEGVVGRTVVDESSGHNALDDAALNVAEMIAFTPALNRDKPVPVWISLPITFTTR